MAIAIKPQKRKTRPDSGGFADDAADTAPRFAKNQVELAAILGVNRKTIQRYLKLDGAPVTRSNGKLSVEEWRVFLESHAAIESVDYQKELALKTRVDRITREERLRILRNQYVAIVDVEKDVAAMIQKAKATLLSGPMSLAPQVVGVSIPEAEKILREWLHDALAKLHADPCGKREAEPQPEPANG